MADNAPKPSSSVKLVLLGEAAVGKVNKNVPGISYAFLYISLFDKLNSWEYFLDIWWLTYRKVLSRIALCQQRLPGK